MNVAAAAVLVAVLLVCLGPSLTQAQQPTPGPDVPPAGELSVSPSSGPIGTVVTLTGHLDQPITSIELRCLYRGEHIEALAVLSVSEPASDFSIQFEIPAELPVRQPRQGEPLTIEPRPHAQCDFRAISWHQLLFASTPFTVTPLLPSTGS